MVWLLVFGFLNGHRDADACNCTRVLKKIIDLKNKNKNIKEIPSVCVRWVHPILTPEIKRGCR